MISYFYAFLNLNNNTKIKKITFWVELSLRQDHRSNKNTRLNFLLVFPMLYIFYPILIKVFFSVKQNNMDVIFK